MATEGTHISLSQYNEPTIIFTYAVFFFLNDACRILSRDMRSAARRRQTVALHMRRRMRVAMTSWLAKYDCTCYQEMFEREQSRGEY